MPLDRGGEAVLFLPGDQWKTMIRKTVPFHFKEQNAGRARALLTALADRSVEMERPVFIPGLALRQVYLGRGGLVYVDISHDPALVAASGVWEERLRLWAIVDTLCRNMDDVSRVKFLVNGNEADVMFGHIDISRPLLPDPDAANPNASGDHEKQATP